MMRNRPLGPNDIPGTVPVFPLSGALLLPRTHRPLSVFEPRYLDMIDWVLGHGRFLALVQPIDTSKESPQGSVPLQGVGTLGRLTHFEDDEDDRYLIVVEGIARVRLGAEVGADRAFRQFEVDATSFSDDFAGERGEAGVDRQRFVAAIRSYADFADLDIDWEQVEQTGTAELVNLCCMLSPYGAAEKQMLLEADTLVSRAESLIAMAEMEMARGKAGQTLQ